VTRNPWVIDAVVAVSIAAIVLILQPGVAIGALLALLVLVICAASFLLGRRRARRSPRAQLRRR
jgi:hypothetical protein